MVGGDQLCGVRRGCLLHFAPGRATHGKEEVAWRHFDAKNGSTVSFGTAKVALLAPNAHPLPMAKTWVPKNDSKSAKAFAKAMRPLTSRKGRSSRGNNRPR